MLALAIDAQGARGLAPSKLNSVPAVDPQPFAVAFHSLHGSGRRTSGWKCRRSPTGASASTWSLPGWHAERSPTCTGMPKAPGAEVTQPHLPAATLLRLHPQSRAPPSTAPSTRVRPPASGVAHFRGVTGGVYKPRERIHRSSADLRLPATPASRGRVADLDPN